MPIIASQWIQQSSGQTAARLVSVEIHRPSWAIRAAILGATVLLAVAAVLLVIPLVLVVGLVLMAVVCARRLRAAVAGLRAPNGVFDRRRNVRVVSFDDRPGQRS